MLTPKNKLLQEIETNGFRFLAGTVVFIAIFLVVLFAMGIFHPSALYYLLLEKHTLVFPDSTSQIYYRCLDEGKVLRDPNEKYDKLVQGTWALESPYALFDFRDWRGWQDTRLYLYPDGRFKLLKPILHLDNLRDYRNPHIESLSGTWKLLGYWCFSIQCYENSGECSLFRYMLLWHLPSSNQYRLCQPLDAGGDFGIVWKKVSDETDE